MSESTKVERPGAQIADELKLQAWLAKAEWQHPSDRDISDEASVLAQMRDELRLQAHLGRMELADEWHQTEDRWRHFMHKASSRTESARGELRGLLKQIRDHYRDARAD